LHPAICGGPYLDIRDDRRSIETILHTDPCEVPKRAEVDYLGAKVHGEYTGGAGVKEVNE